MRSRVSRSLNGIAFGSHVNIFHCLTPHHRARFTVINFFPEIDDHETVDYCKQGMDDVFYPYNRYPTRPDPSDFFNQQPALLLRQSSSNLVEQKHLRVRGESSR